MPALEEKDEFGNSRPGEREVASLPPLEEADGSGHFRPDAWKVAWEASQDVPAPSCEVKAAAERLVGAENVQQALGWVLLTQIGILLGSFGQIMSVGVCMLSFAIFMVEAMLKYVRSWAHRRFFMDVPCAFVPVHQEAAHDSLKVFGRYLVSATLLELLFYVPFIYYVVDFTRYYYNTIDFCNANFGAQGCPQTGTNLLVYLLFICAFTTIVHWMTSLLTVLAFYFAMGRGIVRSLLRENEKKSFNNNNDEGNWRKSMAHSCNCSSRKCKVSKRLSISRNHYDRVLCLTWWVHMARHRHLSAMVASAQPENCGLPGHWFRNVAQIKEIVYECLLTGAGDHVFNSNGPLWVSQEMGLRALVSLAKQRREAICVEILRNKGIDLLVNVVREGKGSTSRGLAAAAIAVLATQHKNIRQAHVDFSVAIMPLRRLLRYKEHELKEVALGALLNIALIVDDEQYQKVLLQFHTSDGFAGGSRGSFMTTLMDNVHSGVSTTCQELAIGLLARLASNSPEARAALIDHGQDRHGGIGLLIDLLQNGMTVEIKVSAAGALSELFFREGRNIGKGPFGESCIRALVEQLAGESRIAYASARALANLAIKWVENKAKIVSAGGIKSFINLLMNTKESNSQNQMQEEVCAEAAKALWTLAYNNKANQERIAEANAIPLLVELLWDRQRVYMQAAAALSSLAWKNEKNQELIGKEGSKVFNRIVQLLVDMKGPTMEGKVTESNINDIKMEGKALEKVAVAISSFADGNKSNRQNLLNAGALGQLEKMAQMSTIYDSKALWRVNQAIDCLKGTTLDKPSLQAAV